MNPIDPALAAVVIAVVTALGLATGIVLDGVIAGYSGSGRPARTASPRVPLVRAGTALFFALVALQFASRGAPGEPQASAALWALPAFLFLAAVSVALAAIDIGVRRLPDRIVLPSIVVGVVLLGIAGIGDGDWVQLVRAVAGGAALFVFYLALVLAYPRGMGFGDVKLAALLGLYLGWTGWDALVVGAVAAFLLGGVFTAVLVLLRRADRATSIPFGPWMLLGAWVGILLGRDIAAGYLALAG